ncbi:hypothetical protein BH20VER1_BH20VER1_05390 [soil metagenome]
MSVRRVTKPSAPRVKNLRISKPRERRQQHLLDVRVRSHTAVQQRNKRLLVITSKLVLIALVCAGIVSGVRYGAKQLFFENPEYRLSNIEFTTDGTLQRERVLEAAELEEGVNIFSVNLGEVRDQLQQLPQVDQVEIRRNMPAEIVIKITERRPVAWITAEKELSGIHAEGAFLVDARGVLMKQKKLLPEYLGLPAIVGCTGESLEAGRTVSSFEAKAALELLKLSTRSFMQTRFQVREIDLSKGYCLLVTDKNRTQVMFGFDNFEDDLQRLEKLLVHADDTRREIATANLMVKRNLPLTWAKTALEVIEETADPEGQEAKRALPVEAIPKVALPATGKSKSNAPKSQVRKAMPVERGRRD